MGESEDQYGLRLLLHAIAKIEYFEFPYFPKLAPELQTMIWKFAVASCGSRAVRVSLKSRWRKERKRLLGSGRSRQVRATATIPGLLHATRESRQIALKRWCLAFAHHLEQRPVFFDWKTDILYFDRPDSALWFHTCHMWNYRRGGDWNVETSEINKNLKYIAVGIKGDPRHHHANLRHRYLIPNRYQNLEAFFICSGADMKLLLRKAPAIRDYIHNFNVFILHSAWVDLFRFHIGPGAAPYTILIPREEVERNAHTEWVNVYGSK